MLGIQSYVRTYICMYVYTYVCTYVHMYTSDQNTRELVIINFTKIIVKYNNKFEQEYATELTAILVTPLLEEAPVLSDDLIGA